MTREGKGSEHYYTAHPKSKPRLGLIQTYLRGKSFQFITASGVFSKRRIDLGTRLLIESMILPQDGRVLDIGCGYGAVGIAAAAFNPRLSVVLVDVNYRATWLARQNLEKNNVCNALVKRGRLYEPVKEVTFDCVLCNPPVSVGMGLVRAIVLEAPSHMTSDAIFQMVIKSKVAGKRLCDFFNEAFGNLEVLARQSGYRVLMSKNRKH